MKKTIVILLALALAGPAFSHADPQDELNPAEKAADAKPVPTGSAFLCLYEIAENARKWRIGAAIPSLVIGSALGIFAVWLWTNEDFYDYSYNNIASQITLASALFVSGVGILNLSLKSSAERRYYRALMLSAEERDVFCAAALKKESSQAKVGRFVSAGIYSGLAALVLLSAHGYENEEFARFFLPHVIALGTSVLYKLVFSSFEERMYRRYLKEEAPVESGNKLALHVGLARHGFSLGVRYNFQ
jgi:hypothetical protein